MGLVVSRTALHWACKRSHVVIAEHLLRKGADVNLASTKGESVAQVTSDDQVLKLLSRYGESTLLEHFLPILCFDRFDKRGSHRWNSRE